MYSVLCSPSSFTLCSKLDVKYFYITVIAVVVVPASAFEGSISITGNAELAGNITITCSWTLSLEERLFSVQVQSPAAEPDVTYSYYYIFRNGFSWASPGTQNHNRTFHERFNIQDLHAIVRITNLQYSDEKNYSCYFIYGTIGTPLRHHEATSYLAVKARSSTPSITLTPSDITAIKESSSISAFCATNVCQPGRGILQWKIYRNGVLDVIQATDSRLDEMKRVDLGPGEDKCTHHVEQTFKMQVTSTEQNLVIACFVQIDGGPTPDACQSPVTDLCNQTEKLTIDLKSPESKSADTWQEYGMFIIAGIFALLLALAAALLLIIYLKSRKATPPSSPPPEPQQASVEEEEEPVEERADSASEISENESSVDFEARSEVDG